MKKKDDYRKKSSTNKEGSFNKKSSHSDRPVKKNNNNDFPNRRKYGEREQGDSSKRTGTGNKFEKFKGTGSGNSEKPSFDNKRTGGSQNRSTTGSNFNDRKTSFGGKRNFDGNRDEGRKRFPADSTGQNPKYNQRSDDRKNQSERGDRKSFQNNSSDQKGKGKSYGSQGKGKFQNKNNERDQRSDAAPNYFLKTKSDQSDGQIRLNRYIANSGVCSRREADELIEQGLIEVNGKVITELGYKVNPTDLVKYDGKSLRKEKPVYIILNKPKDYITTMDDPEERKTVMHIIAGACKERVYPVGRLDRNTTGLLLLTNDGDLAEKLTHPSNQITKIYQVELDAPLTNDDFETISEGKVHLEDGKVNVDEIAFIDKDKRKVGVSIHEGRNRIVRRLFEHLGYQVEKLDRTVYAGLTKRDLPRGHWRFLTEKEVVSLKFKL